MADVVLTWLVRFGHVLAAACWTGGYALLALVLVPRLRRGPSPELARAAVGGSRVLTYAGGFTIISGLLLVARTRGFTSLGHGEWGGIVVGALVLAIALVGLGDGLLRPGLRGIAAGGEGRRAARWAVMGALLSAAAIGLMTRALYAPS